MTTKPKQPKRPTDVVSNAVHVMKVLTGEAQEINPDAGKDPAAVALGRKGGAKGGKKRAANMTKEQRVAAAKRAIKARWKDRPTEPNGTSVARPRRQTRKVRAKIPSPEG